MGEVLRTAGDYDASPGVVDGLRNYWHQTVAADGTRAVMMAGINTLGLVDAIDGPRTPAILIRSTPHKAGTTTTPWQDHFDTDNGHIRYFGDNKLRTDGLLPKHEDPADSPGNSDLLRALRSHQAHSRSDRLVAIPILFFRTPSSGRVQFEGFGVIESASVVSQRAGKTGRSFSNYVFDFLVLDVSAEAETFDWRWIEARRDPGQRRSETHEHAPASWKEFVNRGVAAAPRIRRRVSRTLTVSASEQRPTAGSQDAKTLQLVYEYYDGRKSRFEALAEVIAERVLGENGRYRSGWVTAEGSDGGADFIGRLDIGSGFGVAKLIVLGQAKCEKLDAPTGGNHIARTVARLRRGWLGVYVTTSYFSDPVQREIYEDEYPIVLVNGLRIATELNSLAIASGAAVIDIVKDIDSRYETRLQHRDPREILLD